MKTPRNIPICNAVGDEFRNYKNSSRQEKVAKNYKENRINMTYDFVLQQEEKWLGPKEIRRDKDTNGLTHGRYTIWDIAYLLDRFIDDSDPDVDVPNIIHMFQTAEKIREAYPDEKYDWFHLVGLLHDLGKVMSVWGESQWAVVGDTFPVGCEHSRQIIFSQFFEENSDTNHPLYSTKYGIYEPRCGIEELKMSWGHDEYLYQVLKKNGCTLPKQALQMIRYHSFYPWHKERAYTYFETPFDRKMLEWVQLFNKFDLYSKKDSVLDLTYTNDYYNTLLEKYNLDGELKW